MSKQIVLPRKAMSFIEIAQAALSRHLYPGSLIAPPQIDFCSLRLLADKRILVVGGLIGCSFTVFRVVLKVEAIKDETPAKIRAIVVAIEPSSSSIDPRWLADAGIYEVNLKLSSSPRGRREYEVGLRKKTVNGEPIFSL